MFRMKCPRCRQGDLFIKPFNFSKPLAMESHCQNCNLNYEPEPGYYFGAMFISYIWTGWLCLFIVGITIIFLGWTVTQSIALLVGMFVVTYFWILRVSRSMYIHFDIPFDKKNK